MSNRPEILRQLAALLKATPGVTYFARNDVTEIAEGVTPAVVLLDGGCSASESQYGRKRGPRTPAIMTMAPQIAIVVSALDGATLGDALAEMQDTIISSVLSSEAIFGLTLGDEIRVSASTMDVASERKLVAQTVITLGIDYVQ